MFGPTNICFSFMGQSKRCLVKIYSWTFLSLFRIIIHTNYKFLEFLLWNIFYCNLQPILRMITNSLNSHNFAWCLNYFRLGKKDFRFEKLLPVKTNVFRFENSPKYLYLEIPILRSVVLDQATSKGGMLLQINKEIISQDIFVNTYLELNC